MKGRPVTDAEKLLHDRVAQLGCVACRQEGIFNTHISIHHVHGRTKPGAHMHVLPLCAPHHVDDGTALAVHPHKRRWEERYGKQDDLVAAQWKELGVEHKAPERRAKPLVRKSEKPVKKTPGRPVLQPKQPVPELTINPAITPKSSAPKVTRPKPVKTPQQLAFIEQQKAQQKKIMDQRKPAMKAQAKAFADARKAEYLEANKDSIAERKARQKEDQKRFRAEQKRKFKQAS